MKNQLNDQYQGQPGDATISALPRGVFKKVFITAIVPKTSVRARLFSTLAVGVLAIASIVVATPASAAQCKSKGQAFYIDDGPNAPRPGFNYTSGFEGDMTNGIFLLSVTRGDKFRLAGNGILPSFNSNPSVIAFTAVKRATGEPAPIFQHADGTSTSFVQTSPARFNCVVMDNDPMNSYTIGPVPNGKYRIFASYRVPGTGVLDRRVDNEPVIDLSVKNSR
jgi:hypothetical protein